MVCGNRVYGILLEFQARDWCVSRNRYWGTHGISELMVHSSEWSNKSSGSSCLGQFPCGSLRISRRWVAVVRDMHLSHRELCIMKGTCKLHMNLSKLEFWILCIFLKWMITFSLVPWCSGKFQQILGRLHWKRGRAGKTCWKRDQGPRREDIVSTLGGTRACEVKKVAIPLFWRCFNSCFAYGYGFNS